MKKLGYGFGGLVVVLIAAVLIVPSLVDWNDYKAEIATEIQDATGRDVVLNGDLSFGILPQPHLSVADARLANPKGASTPYMVTLKEMRVAVKLLPLLQGSLQIDKVELIEPVIALETLADGTGNWVFAPVPPETSSGVSGSPEAVPAASQAPQPSEPPKSVAVPSATGGAEDFKLDSLKIINGTFVYRDAATGVNERVDGVTLEASAESVRGPFSVDGEVSVKNVPVEIEAEIGRFAEKGTIPVSAKIRSRTADALITLKGTVTDIETVATISARLDASGKELSTLISAFNGGSAPAGLSGPFSLTADIAGTQSEVYLNELALSVGQTKASGGVRIRLGDVPVIEVTLRTELFDANQLLAPARPSKRQAAAPTSQPSPQPAVQPSAGASVDRPVASASDAAKSTETAAAARMGVPSGIAATITLFATEIAWKEGRAREGVLSAALQDGVFTLSRLSAKLPGDADFQVSGRVSGGNAGGADLTYSGKVAARAANLRAMLAWLETRLPGVAADRLRTLSLAGDFSGNRAQVQLTGVSAKLDATRLSGGVTVALRDRPAFGARVSVDQVNIDSYLPPGRDRNTANGNASGRDQPGRAGASGEAAGTSAADATGSKPDASAVASRPGTAPPGPLALLNGFDANLVLRVGNVLYRGGSIRDIRFDGTLQNGALNIRDASIRNFAGTSAQIKGTLSGFDGLPLFKGTVAAASDDLTGLFGMAGLDPGVPPENLGKMRLTAATDFVGDRLSIDADLQLGALRTGVKGGATGFPLTPRFDLRLDSRHPDFRRLVRMFMPEFSPRNARLGAFRLATNLKGDLDTLEIGGIDGSIGKIGLTGTGTVRRTTQRPAVTLDLRSGVIPVTDFLAAPRRAAAPSPVRRASVSPAVLKGDTPELTQVTTPSRATTRANTAGRWSREKFDTSLFDAVDADITLNAQALLYDNLRVDTPRVLAVLSDRVLEIKRVTGKMFDGAFEMTGQLDTRAMPTARSSVTVTKANVQKLLFDAAAVDLASGILTYRMDLTARGQSQHDMVRALNGTGRIDVADGVIKGFDLRKVSDGLNNLNQVAGLLGLLSGGMAGGSTPFSKLDGTFRIENGVMRTDDLKLIADAGAGISAGYVDLPAWNMDILSEFRLTEHPKAPPFRVRSVGAPDAARQVIDFEALQAWALSKGAGRLIEKFLPGAKEEPAAPSQQGQPSSQPQQLKPEDILKELFKLGR